MVDEPLADARDMFAVHTVLRREFGLVAGEIIRAANTRHRDDDDFVQPRTLVEQVLNDQDRDHLVTNITSHIKGGVHAGTLPRALDYWRDVSADLCARVAKQVNGT